MSAEATPNFSPVRQPSLAERVEADLREAILDGRMRPGDKVSDARIAEAMGVSRSPVREAIRHLAAQGLVREQPRRGAYVTSLSRTEVHEVYECRRALEAFAAQRLSQTTPREAARRLQEIVEEMDKVSQQGSREALAAIDQSFHRALCSLTSNGWLERLYSVISDQMLVIMNVNAATHPLDEVGEMVAIHLPIVEAISAGDEARATAAVLEHLRVAEEQLGTEAGPLFEDQ
jgi:DNA-binding GntR family transcriptional regulator